MAKKAAKKAPKKPATKVKKKVSPAKKMVQKSKKKPSKKATTKVKKKVSFLPKGYNVIIPYLIVNDAAKALEFYEKVFAAKEVSRMPRPDGKIGHSELKVGESKIMLADEYPEIGAHSPHADGNTSMSIHIYVKNVDEVVDKAVNHGAKIKRPVQDMYYGDRSGGLLDPFGHQWYVSTHIEDVTKAQMKKRSAQMYGKKAG